MKFTKSVLATISAFSVLFIISASMMTMIVHDSNAQIYNNTINTGRNVLPSINQGQAINPRPMLISPGAASTVNNGSISIQPILAKTVLSQIHVNAVNAIMSAIRTIGANNSSGGFLVYIISVVDSNSNLHRVVVDAGNGKVLSSIISPLPASSSIINMVMAGGAVIRSGGITTPSLIGQSPGRIMRPDFGSR